jgi:hypothetical protein
MNFLRIFGNKENLTVSLIWSLVFYEFDSFVLKDIKFHDWEVSQELRKRKVEYSMEVIGSKLCNSVETEVWH